VFGAEYTRLKVLAFASTATGGFMDGFRAIVLAIPLLAPVTVLTTSASAQTYPNKPIRFIAGGAGSPADMRARQVAQKLKDSLGQPVIVDNRPGANGAIGAKLAAKSAPDGYTLFNCSSLHALNDILNPDPASRLNKELVPITRLTLGWLILAVHPSIPATSLREFIDLAKAKPGALSYSSSSQGSLSHLLGELIKLRVGINMRAIPYKFTAAEIPDILGGHIHATFNYYNILGPHFVSGKLRALAIAAAKRLAVAPDLVTMSEAGLTGVEATGWNGVCVPAGVPQPVIGLLYRELVKALGDPVIREQMISTGADPGGERPEEFAAFIGAEMVKWGKVVKASGIVIQ
jgi:tripartite-type tricarboxylate transporter receptor subunit TctC